VSKQILAQRPSKQFVSFATISTDRHSSSITEEGIRIRWCGWASNPVEGVRRSQVGSTPAAFRRKGLRYIESPNFCLEGARHLDSRRDMYKHEHGEDNKVGWTARQRIGPVPLARARVSG
jgi:hypothetical protein